MASKYKKNKVKFRWTKELLFLILGLVAIIGATIALSIPTNGEKITTELNDAIYAANVQNSQSEDTNVQSISYTALPNDNVFESISHKKLVKEIANSEYVYVLYGSKNSTVVLENVSTINTTAVAEEIETIYVYSSLWVEEAEDREAEAFKEQKKAVEDEINANKDKDVTEFSVLSYPALLVFHNGSLVFNSQQYDDLEYSTWAMYIQKALFISKANQ